MSDIYSKIPKQIKLIVNKGQDLQLYHPKKVIKHQPRKWRVLFLGVVEKMATAKVESDNGNPEWLCEITVTAKNSHDPISLLVTDSKGRHIGQVLISLSNIPPPPTDCTPGSRPPLVFSNIHKSELEPTKKNSYPKGELLYWIWADSYWRNDEIIKTKERKSISRSMHDLSNSTLNLFRRKKSTTSFQDLEIPQNNIQGRESTEVNLRASPLKVNNLKKKLKPGSDSSSSTNSQMQSATTQNSPVYNGIYNKNPFDAIITTDISIENNIKQEQPYAHKPSHSHQSSLQHKISIGSKGSPVSNIRKPGLFNKFKSKKSQSTADLTKTLSEKEQANVFYPLPQSLGKQQGQRFSEKNDEFSKSSMDITSSWFCGDGGIPIDKNITTNRTSRRMNRPQSCLIRPDTDPTLINEPGKNHYLDHNGVLENAYKSNTLNNNFGLHQADLQMNKNREDMSKRELIGLVNQLENQLNVTTERCKAAEKQTDKLCAEKKELQEDLSIVKDELCRLKLRLLEAGDDKYLEKTVPRTRAEVLSDLALWRVNSKL